MRQLDVVPPEGEAVLADFGDTEARQHRERERAGHQRLFEIGSPCLMRV